MEELGLYDCPMPESFRDKIGITIFLAWLFYLGFVSRVIFAPLMPEIERELGIGHGEAGTMFLLMSFGYLLAPVCSGFISSRINHLGTLKLSAWLLGLSLLAFSFVENLLAMGGLLMIIGFAGSIHLPSAIATITAEIQASDWGKGLSVHQCAPPLSFVTAPLIAAMLLKWFSWREILFIWSILSLFSAFLYTIYGKGGAFPGRAVSVENVKIVGGNRSFWIMVLLLAMAVSGNVGIFTMLPLYLVTERGFDFTWANTLIGLSQLSGIIMVVIAGWFTDKVGQKNVMAFSLLMAALLTMMISFTKGWLLLFVLFFQAAVLTSFFPAGFAALSRVAEPSLRSVTSALGPPLAFLVGAGLMPAAIGYVAESYSFATGIFMVGAFMLFGPVLVLCLKLGDYDGQSGC